MKVKKYIVDSMPDALQKIRVELGKDAVIVNTKEIRVGGVLGFFGKKKIEVVAATDSNPDSALKKPTYPSPPSPPVPSASPAFPKAEASPHSSLSTAPDSELLKEMRQMKEMIKRLSEHQSGGEETVPFALPEPFQSIRLRLIEHEVHPELAKSIVEEAYMEIVSERAQSEELPEEQARDAVKKHIVNLLLRHPVEQIAPEAKIVHFVGPTGVGKTTTIAKLAAEQTLRQHKSIGLITADTYRIAAIEQLRTYASILNVPLEVVFSPADLRKALDKMQDLDMVLMDTAGRNFRNEMAVSELNSLLRIEQEKDTFLVLSLSMKYSDMKAVADNFYKFGIRKVLFTKADETTGFGSIVNLFHDFSLCLSYITDGQNVPDDIHLADAERIAEELVGVNS